MIKLRVRELLAEQKKTTLWLMVNLLCTKSYAEKLANNEIKRIDFATIGQLCDIFHCTPNELFHRE